MMEINKKLSVATLLMLFSAGCALAQQENDEPAMTKQKDVYTVNTTTLCAAKGFKGTTPLLVRIRKGKILSVEALPNLETPRFFMKVEQMMLPAYAGKTLKDYDQVDCVTGATRSSIAVKANVCEAVEYYKKHK